MEERIAMKNVKKLLKALTTILPDLVPFLGFRVAMFLEPPLASTFRIVFVRPSTDNVTWSIQTGVKNAATISDAGVVTIETAAILNVHNSLNVYLCCRIRCTHVNCIFFNRL